LLDFLYESINFIGLFKHSSEEKACTSSYSIRVLHF